MKIIKRDGHMVDYCPEKIELAIKKANNEVLEEEKVTDIQIRNIIKYWSLPTFINSLVNSFDEEFFATIFDILGSITLDNAPDKLVNSVLTWLATEYKDTAIVPDTAPNTNWSTLQFILSTIAVKNNQIEYPNIVLNKIPSKP